MKRFTQFESQSRRKFCRNLALAASTLSLPATNAVHASEASREQALPAKRWPSSGEYLSAIGMGTWITFDVPDDKRIRDQRTAVLQSFFDMGGQLIDSSPMYGRAEDMLGYGLQRVRRREKPLFAASKIWTPVAIDGRNQMRNTEKLWGVEKMDLMFVHNLVAWEKHLPQLHEWKKTGRIRHVGVSTSHGRRHDQLEKILQSESLDCIQLTLNIDNTVAEERLLPMAADKGVAVVINRPFERGALLRKYQQRPLPGIARELGCQYWSQYLLLYIVSHPAVTVAIPATSKVEHMKENMATLMLELPDERTRVEMRRALIG